MSLFSDAHAVVLIADFIGADAAGKLNAIGAGFAISGIGPDGQTPPQHVAVMVDVPSKYAGDEYALLLELRNETTGAVVQVPSATGQLEALRMQQVVRVERPALGPAIYLPNDMTCRSQVTIGFPMGLPLEPGNSYAWQLRIDGQHRPGWIARFHVVGPRPGLVFGGPAGPADIPDVETPTPDS